MKKNRVISASFAASVLLFAACSSEVESVSNPTDAGAGEALVRVSMQFPEASSSYAIGEEVADGIAKDSEKLIESIAFFAFTEGDVGIYLSEEKVLAPNGFIEPLLPAADGVLGHYTATFKIKSSRFGEKTPLYAVANYAENGLVFNLAAIKTVADLKDVLSKALAENASLNTPLLMTCSLEDNTPVIDGRPNSAVVIEEGYSFDVSFPMERIVSRIDVVNNAYNAATPTDNFELLSARLLSAPAEAALFIGETVSVPTYINTGYKETVAIEGVDLLAKQVLEPLYVNPGSNGNSATATRIEVVGRYKNEVFRKKIAFKTADALVGGTLVPGVIVPMRRNYRYIVNINKSAESEDLQFNVTVKDWDDAETIIIKPSIKAPKLENFAFNADGNTGVGWNVTDKILTLTLDGELAVPVVLTFDASAFQAPKAAIAKSAGSLEFIKSAYIALGELTGYATEEDPMPLKRTFTITIPTDFNSTLPIKTGTTHINTIKIMVSEGFVTPITVKYKDNRKARIVP